MDSSETMYLYKDITPELQEIITNQQKEIEQLEIQTAYLAEQNNGFSLIINYQFATIGFIVIASVVAVLWNVLNKWFFRGV